MFAASFYHKDTRQDFPRVEFTKLQLFLCQSCSYREVINTLWPLQTLMPDSYDTDMTYKYFKMKQVWQRGLNEPKGLGKVEFWQEGSPIYLNPGVIFCCCGFGVVFIHHYIKWPRIASQIYILEITKAKTKFYKFWNKFTSREQNGKGRYNTQEELVADLLCHKTVSPG